MVEFEGMPKKEEHKQEHKRERENDKDDASSEASSNSESKHSAWTGKAKETSTAIRKDQEQKKASKFPTPGEAYHDEETEIPVSTSQSSEPTKESQAYQATAWTGGTYEHPRAVARDQDLKKEAGFPAPGEAFPTSPSLDPQRSVDEPRKDHASSSKSVTRESGRDVFTKGPVLHSSELDTLEEDKVKGKTIVVIGSGASGVESVETALAKGAKHTIMVARDDKVRSCLYSRSNVSNRY